MARPTASIEPRRSKPDSISYKLVVASFGLALLLLGGQQIITTMLRAYGEAGMDLELSGAPLDAETVASRVRLLEFSDGWFGDPAARIDAGLYNLRLVEGIVADGKLHPESLDGAVADLSDGLARAPANPLAWTALGDARVAAGDRAGAAAALNASILLGPNELYVTLPRSDLGMKLWSDLDSAAKRAVMSQMKLAWDYNPAALVALVRSNGNALPVMIALATDVGRLTAFMKALAARH